MFHLSYGVVMCGLRGRFTGLALASANALLSITVRGAMHLSLLLEHEPSGDDCP